jgi:hypothetical protein
MAVMQIKKSNNPVIKKSGSARFGKNHHCTWYTTDGSKSIITIHNPGRDNTLTFIVNGAPETIHDTDGKKFNGLHEIPPNCPTCNVTAIGDFKGQMQQI